MMVLVIGRDDCFSSLEVKDAAKDHSRTLNPAAVFVLASAHAVTHHGASHPSSGPAALHQAKAIISKKPSPHQTVVVAQQDVAF